MAPGPSAADGQRGTPTESRVSRRSILQTLGGTAIASGLAGCSGVLDRRYEASPVDLPVSKARFLGYGPEPTVERRAVDRSTSLGDVGDVSVRTITQTRRWTYAPALDADSSSGGDGAALYKTNCDDIVAMGPIATGAEASGGGSDGSPPTGVDVSDTLVVHTTPDPTVAGVRLNPVATASIESLIEEHTAEFRAVCDCDVGGTGDVTVESARPRDRYAPEDAGEMVFALDPPAGGPETVALLDGSRPVRYFGFVTTGETGGAEATLLLAARAGYESATGEPSTAVVVYVGRRPLSSFDEARPVVGEGGLFTPDHLSAYADRFALACPCLSDDSGSGDVVGRLTNPDAEPPRPPSGESGATLVEGGPEQLSEDAARRLWEEAAGTPATREVLAVAGESFGLAPDESTASAARVTEEGPGSFVVFARLEGGGREELSDPVYLAHFDGEERFRAAGVSFSRRTAESRITMQSFASVDGDRRDVFSRIRKGRIQEIRSRTVSSSAGRSGGSFDWRDFVPDDWEDELEKFGCGVCNLSIYIIERIIKRLGCSLLGYTSATGALSSFSPGPLGGSAGAILMRALCNQLATKSINWMTGLSDCCLCYEVGVCSQSHCESLYLSDKLQSCGCCSCDDGGGSGGGGGGSGGGGGGGGGSGGGGGGGGGGFGGGTGTAC